MAEPVRVMYHGDLLSVSKLQRAYGIRVALSRRWHEQGQLNERTIDAHLAERARRRHLHALMAENGVRRVTFYERLRRGVHPEMAARTPVRKGADRAR